MPWSENILGTPATIGPFYLEPITVGQYLALRQVKNPYVFGGQRLPHHFANVVWICEGPKSGDLRSIYFDTHEAQKRMYEIAAAAAKDFESADAELDQWLRINSEIPKFHTHQSSPINFASSNSQIEIAHNLWTHHGIAWREALKMPRATAIAMHVAAMERRGYCRVSDAKREAAIQAAEELYEQRLREEEEQADGAEL